MHRWNDDFYGWPIHDFQWAYLESLMVGTQPVADSHSAWCPNMAATNPLRTVPAWLCAEPTFTPQPAHWPETRVSCCSPRRRAPLFTSPSILPAVANSPVYRAPIMIKGSGLTSKHSPARQARKTAQWSLNLSHPQVTECFLFSATAGKDPQTIPLQASTGAAGASARWPASPLA